MKSAGLTKSTALYTFGNLFVRSASFLLLPLYSNYIPPQEFGNYALLMSFYALAMVLYQGGYQAALNNYYHKEANEEQQKAVLATIGRTAIGIGLLVSLLIILLSADISELIFDSSEYQKLVNLIAGAMFFETAGAQVINYLVTKGNASKVVLVSAIGAIINFLLNIYLIYYLSMGVTGIIAAQLISALAVTLMLTPWLLKMIRYNFDKYLLKEIYLFTIPLIIGGFFSVGVDVADRFILNYYLGKTDVGIYSFSYRIALLMNLFVISFRTAWTPHSLKLYYNKLYETQSGETILKYISAAGVIFISVALLTNDLFKINLGDHKLFNEIYLGGIIILPFILGGYFLNGINSFYSVYPFVSNKTYHFIVSDGLAFLVNLGLNILLIPLWGLTGAAFATFISFTMASVYLFILTSKHFRIKYPLKEILTVLILIILFTSAGQFINNFFTDILFVTIYLWVVIYVLKIRPDGLLSGKRMNESDQLY